MNLTLTRVLRPQATFGILSGDDFPLCVTLERPWLDNAPDTSCIQAGTYACIPHNTPEKPNCWEVTGVPGRSAILIHVGNFVSDSEGCILVGTSFDGNAPEILGSVNALNLLREKLPATFDLTITSI